MSEDEVKSAADIAMERAASGETLHEEPEESEDTTEKEIAIIEEVMQNPEIESLNSIMLTIWRLFYVARTQMTEKSGGKVTPEIFNYLMTALSEKAMEPYKISTLRKDLKNQLNNWLKTTSVQAGREFSERTTG